MFTIYATDYAPVDPITPPCDIVPIFIGYRGENKARCLVFDLTECVNTFGDGGFVISFIRQGDELPYLVTDTDRLDNNAIWIITDTDTAVDGYGMVQLQYIVDDVVCKSALYRTVTFDSNGIPGDVPDPYEDLLAQIAAYAAQAEGAATTATAAAQTATTAVEEGVKTERSQRIAADEGLNTRINELMGLAGAPSMANSAVAMTDSSKIYVYTGSEAGYLTGHWYYYNGTEWADGGVYQATAINTDKTLTVENMAADAAVVGDRIDECMAAFVTETTSGSIASFADGADDVPLKDLVVNITPKQAGTGDPSPSNVRAITGYTEANISRAGKNLCINTDFVDGTVDGVTYTMNPDGSILCTGTPSGNAVKRLLNVGNYWMPSGNYILTGGSEASYEKIRVVVLILRANGSASYIEAYTSADVPFTINDGDILRSIYLRSAGTAGTVTIYPMIRSASISDNTYEPYVAPTTYNVSFGSAGTVYGGTLDVTTGMLTVDRKMVTYDGSSDEDITSGSSGMTFKFLMPNDSTTATNPYGVDNCLCDRLKEVSQSSTWGTDYTYSRTNNSRYIYFKIDSTITTVDGVRTYLGTNPISFVYPLAQPVSYQLTPTEVKTLLANNNIWSDTGSVESCEYRADTKLYLEKLTTPDDDMVANANITSGSYFMVNNNLYLATANIANGGAIIPGTNCTATNLAAALNAINS